MNQPVLERSANQTWQVFLVFLRLGLTSFGGPVAHLAYFRTEFVLRRQWLAESAYADLVALCQFLPGPASSQAGMAIGMLRAGYPGALAAWAGFTLPSALLLVLFALSITAAGDPLPAGLLHGLKLAVVAVVAQAVWGMARSLCTDAPRIAIAVVAAGAALAWQQPLLQIAVIAAAALAAPLIIQAPPASARVALPVAVTRRAGASLLLLFFVLLAGLPLLAASWPQPALVVGAAFYRAGALVFGGGHVVLPLLQTAVVPTGWVDENTFLAGYGVTQAMPGPLFAFAAFLGAALHGAIGGWSGALLCLAAISCRRSCCWPARFRSGNSCAATGAPGPRSPASTRRWSACCSPPCAIRCRLAPSATVRTPCWLWRRWPR